MIDDLLAGLAWAKYAALTLAVPCVIVWLLRLMPSGIRLSRPEVRPLRSLREARRQVDAARDRVEQLAAGDPAESVRHLSFWRTDWTQHLAEVRALENTNDEAFIAAASALDQPDYGGLDRGWPAWPVRRRQPPTPTSDREGSGLSRRPQGRRSGPGCPSCPGGQPSALAGSDAPGAAGAASFTFWQRGVVDDGGPTARRHPGCQTGVADPAFPGSLQRGGPPVITMAMAQITSQPGQQRWNAAR